MKISEISFSRSRNLIPAYERIIASYLPSFSFFNLVSTLPLIKEITLCLQYICSLQLEKFHTRSTLAYTNDLEVDSDEWFKYLANGSFGGARGSRTLDLLLAKQALSQLSYGPY